MKFIFAFFVALSFLFASGAHATSLPPAWVNMLNSQDRCLELSRAKESASFCYWKVRGGFQRDGYLQAVAILRDVRFNKAHHIDPNLLDLLFLIQTWLKTENRPYRIEILSGYRTPENNASLRGAGKNSLHMQGKAADIYIPGLKPEVLALMSRFVGAGGVGIYISKNSIHIDTGNLRHWRG